VAEDEAKLPTLMQDVDTEPTDSGKIIRGIHIQFLGKCFGARILDDLQDLLGVVRRHFFTIEELDHSIHSEGGGAAYLDEQVRSFFEYHPAQHLMKFHLVSREIYGFAGPPGHTDLLQKNTMRCSWKPMTPGLEGAGATPLLL
jgi:hypothetical protein